MIFSPILAQQLLGLEVGDFEIRFATKACAASVIFDRLSIFANPGAKTRDKASGFLFFVSVYESL